jgi:hypothetical protein
MSEESHRSYWRRRDESRRRARDDARRSYRSFTDRIREAEAAAFRHAAEVERLDREIARHERETQLRTLRDEMERLRSAALEQMAGHLLTMAWHRQLSAIDLIDAGATATLAALLEEVERRKAPWSFRSTMLPLAPPDGALDQNWPPATRKSLFALDPVEFGIERNRGGPEMAGHGYEDRLDRIASTLASLIARKKEHDLARRPGM